ncbi:MAG TPA: ParB N-terminal domain-containing protein [Polyangiaceae bacterium]|jgi:ParB family chromosome partitioning protein|nr:ParB N-terminal domain-containing protein [Polyangiaceae bacterium]
MPLPTPELEGETNTTKPGRRRAASSKKAKVADASEKPAPKRRRKAVEAPAPRGLATVDLGGPPPPEVQALQGLIELDGGAVLGAYREPLGGNWTVLAGLPIERVEPTPFQRDLSQAHIAKLSDVMDRLNRFLDPIIAVRTSDGPYWTPNGNHRLSALKKLGARSVIALVVPDKNVAYKILALNTEKAHNLREKALEVVRMARSMAALDPRPERDFALEFEEPALLTLGLCYEARGRFSGGPYQPLLRHIDAFLDAPLPEAMEIREKRALKVLELDQAVSRAVATLREQGMESPYLKAFVVARCNPLRFRRGPKGASASPAPPFEETLDAMHRAALRFNPASIRPTDLARAGGPPAEE